MDIVSIHRNVINESSNGLFLWLTNRSQKPSLKLNHRRKNPDNTNVQLQTPIGSHPSLGKVYKLKTVCVRALCQIVSLLSRLLYSLYQHVSATLLESY